MRKSYSVIVTLLALGLLGYILLVPRAPADPKAAATEQPFAASVSSAASSSGRSSSVAAVKTYVLNTNTKKFHETYCSRGPTKESNKSYYTGTRDEVIAKGYEPCKVCNP